MIPFPLLTSVSRSRLTGVQGDVKVPLALAGVGAPVSSGFVQHPFPSLVKLRL